MTGATRGEDAAPDDGLRSRVKPLNDDGVISKLLLMEGKKQPEDLEEHKKLG